MREIKFRAWDKWKEKMIQPHDGDFIRWHAMSNWWDCLDVMQYTGLKDKDGVEIYEGDICRDMGGSLGVIEWSQDECGWLWLNSDEAQTPFCDCEVIGNVYENPELLEGEG